MKQLLERLKEVEIELDLINGDYGERDAYCIYCKSTNYNSLVGIVHKDMCVIRQIRGIIIENEDIER